MFPVDELRIEVDCLASKGYVEIDAIEIVGGILQCTLNCPFLHTSSFQATYLCISLSIALLFLSDMCPLPFFKYRSSCYFIKKDAVSGDEAFVSKTLLL